MEQDNVALLKLSYHFLRQALFGEQSIPEQPGVWDKRVSQRQEIWGARERAEMALRQKAEDEKYKSEG